jgi:hypothetical protein
MTTVKAESIAVTFNGTVMPDGIDVDEIAYGCDACGFYGKGAELGKACLRCSGGVIVRKSRSWFIALRSSRHNPPEGLDDRCNAHLVSGNMISPRCTLRVGHPGRHLGPKEQTWIGRPDCFGRLQYTDCNGIVDSGACEHFIDCRTKALNEAYRATTTPRIAGIEQNIRLAADAMRDFVDREAMKTMFQATEHLSAGDAMVLGNDGFLRRAGHDKLADQPWCYGKAKFCKTSVECKACLCYDNCRSASSILVGTPPKLDRMLAADRRCLLPDTLVAHVSPSAVPRPERCGGTWGGDNQTRPHPAALLERVEQKELARWRRTNRVWPLCRLGGVISMVWRVSTDGSHALGVWTCSKCDAVKP